MYRTSTIPTPYSMTELRVASALLKTFLPVLSGTPLSYNNPLGSQPIEAFHIATSQ